ncbi:phosphotransferase family protein [Agaribacterium haliotis]|uniref:phosphotransferase family protein n=1 Tax=Agaribacterium haliotis TaxID=2013869 RepID=UPI000BB56F77|nr:aminoglycoside phosphotransferase family protein [Agaribacterium haliotis]
MVMIETSIHNTLLAQGVVQPGKLKVTPLSGGVSCEILLLEQNNKSVVLKRALGKLKVKDDWYADVARNKVEQQYLQYVHAFLPGVVPQIYYSNDDLHFFVMELLGGELENWKTRLLAACYDKNYAHAAGEVLGKIHRHSLGDRDAQAMFSTLENFRQLRIEPYLLKTAERNPDLAEFITGQARRIESNERCLVHGDYSPKNILVSPKRLVVLDCEVAWYGDPVFDVAFFLNHFLLKAARKPEDKHELIELASTAWSAYVSEAGAVVDESFEKHLCALLPILMLARVDGKSPVEYLSMRAQVTVKSFVYELLLKQNISELNVLLQLWQSALKGK